LSTFLFLWWWLLLLLLLLLLQEPRISLVDANLHEFMERPDQVSAHFLVAGIWYSAKNKSA